MTEFEGKDVFKAILKAMGVNPESAYKVIIEIDQNGAADITVHHKVTKWAWTPESAIQLTRDGDLITLFSDEEGDA